MSKEDRKEKDKDKDKEFVNLWESRIKAGVEYRKKNSTSESWDKFRDMYRGAWDKDIIPINKIYNYGRMLVPRVYFNSPRVTVTAMHPELVVHARVVESIDNMLIRETKLKGTIKKSVLDSYLCGIAPIKLGFDSEFGYMPEQAIDEGGGTVTDSSRKEGDKIEYQTTIRPGMPWALSVRPDDIIVPYGATDADSLPWIAHYIVRPLEDIKNDQKYNREAIKDIKGTRTSGNIITKIFKPKDPEVNDQNYGEIYEIRDFKTKRIIVICEGKVLLNRPDALQIEGIPYEFISFNPDPTYFWSISDAWLLQPQQRQLNLASTQEARHRAVALMKFLFKKGSIKEPEMTKLLSGLVGPGVEIDDDNIATAIQILQPHIPPDLYQSVNYILGAMKEGIGINSNEMGEFQSGTPHTASETMTVAESFQQRVNERRDIAADALVNIIRKWNQYIFQFWKQEKVIQVVGPEGGAAWIKYTGDQLAGEYFLNVDADTGTPVTKGLKYQMGNDLFAKFNGDPLSDQLLLRQIVFELYSGIDPRVPSLLKVPPMIDPMQAAQERQPAPMGGSAGQGRGSAGGRKGSSPEKPTEFDSFRKRFGFKK